MALGDVAGLLQPMIDSAAGMADTFVPTGLVLLAVALMLTVMNATYQWWMGGVSGAIAKLVRAGIILTIPLFLLYGSNWTTSMKTLTGFFSVELAAPLIQKSGQAGTSGGASAPELVKNIITRVANGIWPDNKPQQQQARGTRGNVFEKAWQFITDPGKSVGESIFSALTEIFFKILLTIIGGGLIVSILFALYGPILLMQVGVIFGPLLICWLVWEPLSDLARTWLKFMITAGFSLLVGLVLALIAAGSVESFVSQMQLMGQDPELPWFLELAAKIGGFVASGFTMIFLAFMLFRADDIAGSMIGSSGAGSSSVGAAIIKAITRRGRGNKDRNDKGGGDK